MIKNVNSFNFNKTTCVENYKIYPKRTKGFQYYKNYEYSHKIGFEGEEIVFNYLKNNNIKVIWLKNKNPNFDLLVNDTIKIDVKTVDVSDFKENFLLPFFQGIKSNYYICVKLPNSIKGYLSSEDIKKLPISNFGYCYAYYCNFDKMKKIEDLIKVLK